jgi:hypothetical protein
LEVVVRRKIWSALLILFGLGVITATVWYVVVSVRHPSSTNSIVIALLSALGAPIALSMIAYGYRGVSGPDAATLKTEAEAMSRAAAALEDAETAEKIKSELEAYVAVRIFRLEIERKRQELSRAVEVTLKMLNDLNADEVLLGEKETSLDPRTLLTLDSLLESSEVPEALDVVLRSIPTFPLFPVTPMIGFFVRRAYREFRRIELRRLARLVSEDEAIPENGSKLGNLPHPLRPPTPVGGELRRCADLAPCGFLTGWLTSARARHGSNYTRPDPANGGKVTSRCSLQRRYPSMRTSGGKVIGGRWGGPPVRRQLIGGVPGRPRCCTYLLYGARLGTSCGMLVS